MKARRRRRAKQIRQQGGVRNARSWSGILSSVMRTMIAEAQREK